jgi:hypothetical protein
VLLVHTSQIDLQEEVVHVVFLLVDVVDVLARFVVELALLTRDDVAYIDAHFKPLKRLLAPDLFLLFRRLANQRF